MNALGPFNPGPYKSVLLPRLPDARVAQQFEGFQYQGLGLLLLVLASGLLAAFRRPPANQTFPWRAGLVVVILAYVLALSTTVTFGSATLFRVPLPQPIENLLALFRASGRLFWPGGFWLILLSLFAVASRLRASPATLFIAAFLAIQLLDMLSVGGSIRTVVARLARPDVHGAAWTRAADAEAFIVIPAWQCGPEQTPGGVHSYQALGFAGLAMKLPTNSFYAARTPSDQAAFHCGRTAADYSGDGMEHSTFVFQKDSYAANRETMAKSHICRDDAPYIVCVPIADHH
jgi:hypothetical protein